ncbi:MAG: efflux RND transporter permease subunit [Candidatus Desulfofervidus auxilii]|nr:efflux RND transporter permease subunit [Candidatus Desulfofervidus auxilii]
MKLPEFGVKRPIATLMLFSALILMSITALFKLNIDLFPEIEPPIISVLTYWPGASAEDVEKNVTKYLEDQLITVNNLDELTSKSITNLSLIQCKFEWGTDLDTASNDIRDKIELAKRDLPPDIEKPVLFKFSSATAPILFMTVTADVSWPRLYYITDKIIGDELRRVPGVGAVILYGGDKRQINVYFDLDKIKAYNLSLYKIREILKSENLDIPTGSIKLGKREYYLRIPARYKTVEEIKNCVVGYFHGNPIYLKDIAQVSDSFEERIMNGWGDGKPAIVVLLQKQTGKNTVEVADRVKEKLKKIEKILPRDVKINIVEDNSEYIKTALNQLKNTLFQAIILVIIVVFVFLLNIRSGIIVAITIPCSLIISFLLLYLGGYTINVVSLMSMAIASGMVVDNAIVVVENITKHVERGSYPHIAAIYGTSEMGMAITASTFTTVVIFIPLMFVTGITGIMFKQLGYVITATLLTSLFTALTLTPMLSSKFLTLESKKNSFTKKIHKSLDKLDERYKSLLTWALKHRKTVIAISLLIFIPTIFLLKFIGTAFVPEPDAGFVSISFRLAEGTRLEETSRLIDKINQWIAKEIKPEELRHTYGFAGQTEKGFGEALGFEEGSNCGEVGLKLVDKNKRRRSDKEIAAILREYLKHVPGITRTKVIATNPISAVLMGGTKPIVIEVLGYNLEESLKVARKIKKIVQEIPGAVDVSLSFKDPRPEIWIEVDRKKAASLGLNIAIIADAVRTYFYGNNPTDFRDAGEDYDIFVRLTDKDKNRLETLPEVPIFTPDGRMILLKNIAHIKEGTGLTEIERKNRQRIIKVEADTYKRSLGEVTRDIKKELEKLNLPPGVTIQFGGYIKEQREAFKDLKWLLLLGIILTYMVMASLYEGFLDPFVIMFSVPFAFTGVIWAFLITGIILNIISFMGIVMLTGIVVNNAIVLLDYTHLLQKRGLSLYEAIIEAGRSRLRPVLMTTLTTIFGMLPMALDKGVGSEIWNALGITVIGGLSLSTLITLILIPTLYSILEEWRKRIK